MRKKKDNLLFQNSNHRKTIDYIVLGLNELLNWSRTQPPTLKVDADASIDIGMLKTSLAIEVSSR